MFGLFILPTLTDTNTNILLHDEQHHVILHILDYYYYTI